MGGDDLVGFVVVCDVGGGVAVVVLVLGGGSPGLVGAVGDVESFSGLVMARKAMWWHVVGAADSVVGLDVGADPGAGLRPDVCVAPEPPPYVPPGPLTFVASGGASGLPPLAVGAWPETAAAMEAKAVATTAPATASSTPARRPTGGSAGGAVVTGAAGSGSVGSCSGSWDTAHPCLQAPAEGQAISSTVPCGASRYHPVATMVRVCLIRPRNPRTPRVPRG